MTFVFTFFIIIRRRAIIECALVSIMQGLSVTLNKSGDVFTERVRDTLIHELCHAAVWLIHGVNGGHGPHWKFW